MCFILTNKSYGIGGVGFLIVRTCTYFDTAIFTLHLITFVFFFQRVLVCCLRFLFIGILHAIDILGHLEPNLYVTKWDATVPTRIDSMMS